MSSKLEPAIWSRDIGQRIFFCFDRCQLTEAWMSNIKEGRYKPWVHVSVNLLAGVAAILRDSVVVVHSTRPLRAHEQITAWKMLCAVFTHSLFLYQKTHSFATLTRSFSDTLSTRA